MSQPRNMSQSALTMVCSQREPQDQEGAPSLIAPRRDTTAAFNTPNTHTDGRAITTSSISEGRHVPTEIVLALGSCLMGHLCVPVSRRYQWYHHSFPINSWMKFTAPFRNGAEEKKATHLLSCFRQTRSVDWYDVKSVRHGGWKGTGFAPRHDSELHRDLQASNGQWSRRGPYRQNMLLQLLDMQQLKTIIVSGIGLGDATEYKTLEPMGVDAVWTKEILKRTHIEEEEEEEEEEDETPVGRSFTIQNITAHMVSNI
ncbi:hypothetical protein BGX24_000934 [Mortierella sp. AD032]|nr:hypothetical protein BGX24_000934 [Mortierella sp. AD032]